LDARKRSYRGAANVAVGDLGGSGDSYGGSIGTLGRGFGGGTGCSEA
jgi:hypothetical protein